MSCIDKGLFRHLPNDILLNDMSKLVYNIGLNITGLGLYDCLDYFDLDME